MAVKRIVPDIGCCKPEETIAFYRDLLELEVVMDHGWIITFAGDEIARPQLSVMSRGGSGAPVPDMSIEVDDVDIVYEKAKARGVEIVYAITDEPWGIRRFYMRDPTGKTLNILAHA